MSDRQRIVEAKVRLYNSYVNLVSSSWLMWTDCALFISVVDSRWRIATHPLSNDVNFPSNGRVLWQSS